MIQILRFEGPGTTFMCRCDHTKTVENGIFDSVDHQDFVWIDDSTKFGFLVHCAPRNLFLGLLFRNFAADRIDFGTLVWPKIKFINSKSIRVVHFVSYVVDRTLECLFA